MGLVKNDERLRGEFSKCGIRVLRGRGPKRVLGHLQTACRGRHVTLAVAEVLIPSSRMREQRMSV